MCFRKPHAFSASSSIVRTPSFKTPGRSFIIIGKISSVPGGVGKNCFSGAQPIAFNCEALGLFSKVFCSSIGKQNSMRITECN
jgi:hypothetical protein